MLIIASLLAVHCMIDESGLGLLSLALAQSRDPTRGIPERPLRAGSGHRPASYPSPPAPPSTAPTSSDTGRLTKNRTYLNGAIAAQAYLKRTRTAMRTHGQCRPGMLREQLQHLSAHAFPPAFIKGFVDAIDAYVSMSLGGRDVDPQTWDVLAAIERRGYSQ